MDQHSVIAHFDYEAPSLSDLLDVEGRLEAAIEDARAGELDGHDIAADLSDGSIYMYGPDAEALFAVVRPILESAACLRDTEVTLRFGPPDEKTPCRVETLGR